MGEAEFLSLGSSTGVGSESSERNTSLVGKDVLHVLDGSLQIETLDGSSGFEGVLEVSSNVAGHGLDSLSGDGGFTSVSLDHFADLW